MWAAMSQCCCRQLWFEAPEGLAPEPLPTLLVPGFPVQEPAKASELPALSLSSEEVAPVLQPSREASDGGVASGAMGCSNAVEDAQDATQAGKGGLDDDASDGESTIASLPAPATPQGESLSPRSVSVCSDMESSSSVLREESAATAEFASRLGIAPEDMYRFF
mmetsp:Transcript_97357/g.272454  ORF Transcript_97357/g.272454 Transcript_97357/m.272454 type:complete len:164 (+) Transcript_97357:101-592(+)